MAGDQYCSHLWDDNQYCNHFCGCPSTCQTTCSSPRCRDAAKDVKPRETREVIEGSGSYISRALESLILTLKSKNDDYKIDGEFSNFEFAADVVAGVSPEVVMLTQLGIKLGRLQGLPKNPNNESRLDTYKDLAGYAVILYAYALKQVEEE